jgi:hypothetical protein
MTLLDLKSTGNKRVQLNRKEKEEESYKLQALSRQLSFYR